MGSWSKSNAAPATVDQTTFEVEFDESDTSLIFRQNYRSFCNLDTFDGAEGYHRGQQLDFSIHCPAIPRSITFFNLLKAHALPQVFDI